MYFSDKVPLDLNDVREIRVRVQSPFYRPVRPVSAGNGQSVAFSGRREIKPESVLLQPTRVETHFLKDVRRYKNLQLKYPFTLVEIYKDHKKLKEVWDASHFPPKKFPNVDFATQSVVMIARAIPSRLNNPAFIKPFLMKYDPVKDHLTVLMEKHQLSAGEPTHVGVYMAVVPAHRFPVENGVEHVLDDQTKWEVQYREDDSFASYLQLVKGHMLTAPRR